MNDEKKKPQEDGLLEVVVCSVQENDELIFTIIRRRPDNKEVLFKSNNIEEVFAEYIQILKIFPDDLYPGKACPEAKSIEEELSNGSLLEKVKEFDNKLANKLPMTIISIALGVPGIVSFVDMLKGKGSKSSSPGHDINPTRHFPSSIDCRHILSLSGKHPGMIEIVYNGDYFLYVSLNQKYVKPTVSYVADLYAFEKRIETIFLYHGEHRVDFNLAAQLPTPKAISENITKVVVKGLDHSDIYINFDCLF